MFANYNYDHRIGRDGFPQSYDKAKAEYARRAEREQRTPKTWNRIANNTQLLYRLGPDGEECYAVRLHRTDVVTFYPDGSAVLDSGGWQSATTRDRFRACGFAVFIEGGVASVRTAAGTFTYADRMRVHSDGAVSYERVRLLDGWEVDADPARVLRRRRAALRRGDAIRCESNASSQWDRGNVPEAFVILEAA